MAAAIQVADAATGVDDSGGAAVLMLGEVAFRDFYDRTARRLWAYLAAASGDPALADDLTQEAFIRLLRAGIRPESDEHLRRYLFRIATNLLQDHRRGSRRLAPLAELREGASPGPDAAARVDLRRLLARLKPRERQILWLAHVEGHSHQEIAAITGMRPASLRVLLFRARRRLAGLVRAAGLAPEETP
ncbi:MAG TPA: sigma-70 family RNA polymerase sigma factor [Thermoanaerobaculia bacterium]|nr:sigma-70 family RNA polymerase sigma factor [Thermoanaerobaculia bacterium]